jgi:hypothetical protein
MAVDQNRLMRRLRFPCSSGSCDGIERSAGSDSASCIAPCFCLRREETPFRRRVPHDNRCYVRTASGRTLPVVDRRLQRNSHGWQGLTCAPASRNNLRARERFHFEELTIIVHVTGSIYSADIVACMT